MPKKQEHAQSVTDRGVQWRRDAATNLHRSILDQEVPDDDATRRVPIAALQLARSLMSDADDDATTPLSRARVGRELARTPPPYLPKANMTITWGSAIRDPFLEDEGVEVVFDETDRHARSEIRMIASDRSELGTETTDEWIAHRLASCLGR